MREAVIVDAIRTARGKRKGGFAATHPMDLASHLLKSMVKRNPALPVDRVDDVILGCVTPVGEQGFNIARGSALASGLPISVPGTTINRFCGSGQQAVHFAAQAIMSGEMDIVLAGGVEHMTRVPMGSDGVGGDGPMSRELLTRFPGLVPQGLSAEMVAEKYGYKRDAVDRFALLSQQRAAAAIEAGRFKNEIVPMEVTDLEGNKRVVDTDEHPRPGTTLEALGALKKAFKEDGVISAGNSSGIVDGASLLLVMEKQKARELGLKPRAAIRHMAVAGSDPVIMLLGPIPSTHKTLQRSGLKMSDIDLVEINEAFAPVPMAVMQELHMDPERVNVNGGAIALGHPLGATGGILLATLLNELERRDKRYGMSTMCIGYGMGITCVLDRRV
ncbi:MAG: thiolase family protein [Deltaproteobacteria bacterium]|nr:thiolase family protein [Deltaproteobacteria bacterium]